MLYKNQLNKIEINNDWKSAIILLENAIQFNDDSIEIYIRVLFVLLDVLVEERYTRQEHDILSSSLKKYFEVSYKKFFDNAEYLFFMGFLIPIAEWYFGVDNINKAYEMQKKAWEQEPRNTLYEWAYRFSDPKDKIAASFLARQLLNQNAKKMDTLKSNGKVGQYIIGMLESSSKACR